MINYYNKNTIDELRTRTEYELWVTNFFRSKFYAQKENGSGSYTLNITNSGQLKVTHSLHAIVSFSEKAVKKSLQKFIPLAFGSSFKLQDMVIEWILNINGINEWRFQDKHKEYNKLLTKTHAFFPTYFEKEPDINKAFFFLFKKLSSYRNILTHGSSFLLHDDGSLEMTNKEEKKLLLNPNDQAAYHRICCLVVDGLLNQDKDLLYNISTVKSDLAHLEQIHKITGFVKSPVRYELVRFIVPIERMKSETPYSCDVDLNKIWERMRLESSPVGKNVQLIISLEVVGYTKEKIYTWSIPPSYVPSRGTLQLIEGDPKFDCFLIRAEKGI